MIWFDPGDGGALVGWNKGWMDGWNMDLWPGDLRRAKLTGSIGQTFDSRS